MTTAGLVNEAGGTQLPETYHQSAAIIS